MAHEKQRSMLPIPDLPSFGLTTFDAKDPTTKFPAIEPLLPPKGAPNVLIVLLDDVGFGASTAFGGPCETPNAERLAAGGLKYMRFHTTALCAPTGKALLTAQPSLRLDAKHHGDCDVGPAPELAHAEHQRTARDDDEAHRVLDRAVRQVPRGSGLAVVADGAVRRVAGRWWR